MIVKDAAYLNWRYVSVPQGNYEIYCLERTSDGAVLGLTVLGERRNGLDRGVLLEILTPRDEDGSAARCLLAHAGRRFRQQKKAAMTCWMFPHCHVSRHLADFRFRSRRKEGHSLLYRDICGPLPTEVGADERSWFFSLGDSDFR